MAIKTAEEYREAAERARQVAKTATISEHRRTMLTLAYQYEVLANQAARLEEARRAWPWVHPTKH
jgi:hypothetical protein